MNKGNTAKKYFSRPNTNCAQSALCAFLEETNISEETAMKIASGFGGGIRDREACGAVTGTIMALGLILGQKNDDDFTSKQKVSELTIEFHKRFKEKHGSIVCRDLADEDKCTELVHDGACILSEILNENK